MENSDSCFPGSRILQRSPAHSTSRIIRSALGTCHVRCTEVHSWDWLFKREPRSHGAKAISESSSPPDSDSAASLCKRV